jgi:hypothetical protein
MEPRIRFDEVVRADCPRGTRAAILQIAIATGRKPAQVTREAILAAVREQAALREGEAA